MNWLIICGGSGSTQLYNGIKMFDKNANIKFLINMYDDGKSTGEVRKVMNVLGPSDCRKTHLKCYKNIHENDLSANILSFYEDRFDLNKENALKEVLDILDDLQLSNYKSYVYEFFTQPKANEITYQDFNVSNLIYSVMYSKFGYEKTNEMLCKDLLGIPNDVVLNSFDNVYISAELESGNILKDEAAIVSYNTEDKIKKIIYNGPEKITLNPEALKLIENADNIILSTGTFWSSLFPTFEYGDLYKYINESKAFKIWVTNTIEDKDSKGVKLDEFYNHLKNVGLNLDEFSILENLDAVENLRFANHYDNVISKHLGNINGKHDAKLVASYLYLIANKINIDQIKNIVLDFDDTIYSRNPTNENKELTKKIFKCLKKINLPTTIVSGNTYESITEKLDELNVKYKDITICANANSQIVHNGKFISIKEFEITEYAEQIKNYVKAFNLIPTYEDHYHIKFKGLTQLERILLQNTLNSYFNANGIKCKAMLTGKTTIDILNKNNNKVIAIKKIITDISHMMYIGDEIFDGNDSSIPTICENYFNVNSLNDTYNILEAIRTILTCDMD